MKKIIVCIAVSAALISSVIMTSCSSVSDKSTVFSEKDNGLAAQVSKGAPFKITLEGNPTTGYIWEVSKLDTSLIQLDGTEYVRSSDLTGAGGIYEWTFKATREGTSEIGFVYHRPWEKDEKPIKTFKLVITSGQAN